jgi:TRAP transporter TAXI family solute receptor
MKKKFIIEGALIAAILLFVGYRFFDAQNAAPTRIRIATGGESGVYYAYGEALAAILEKRMNIPVITVQSGGSVENIRLLRNNRAEIAFVQNDIMTYAYNGTNLFSTEGAFKNFYAVTGLYPEVCQIVARREIGGILDLKGKRVSVGDEGSGTELNALQILDAYGMSFADLDIDHLSFNASVRAFVEGRIDAFFCTAGVPTPAINDLSSAGGAHLLNVGQAHARALISRYQFYSQHLIPRGSYRGIDGEAETVAVKATLVASGNLSEQIVSEIIKILFDSQEEISKTIPESGALGDGTALDGIPIPLHPGAEKHFFKK